MKKFTKTNSNSEDLVKIDILGVGLTNETKDNILEYIVKNLSKNIDPYYIVTPNPEMIVLANKDAVFKTILNNARIALVDGMQLYRYARIKGIPLKGRIIGTNFVESLCEKVADQPITVGFLGGGPKIAELAAECLLVKFPKLKIVFAGSEWGQDFRGPAAPHPQKVHRSNFAAETFRGSPSRVTPHQNSLHLPSAISHTPQHIDVLFVALGFPQQEKWMAEHVGKIPVKVMMGVGGALDQIVDPSLRPPAFVHNAGFGWLYRLIRQPWRIKRQAKLIEFIRLALK